MRANVISLLGDLGCAYSVEKSSRSEKIEITGVSSLEKATENDLTFCSTVGTEGVTSILNTKAGVVLCQRDMEGMVFPKRNKAQSFIFLDNPRLIYIQIVNRLYKKKKLIGISPSAIISKSATIAPNCYIGNYCTVGDNCEIADNTVIYDRVSILQETMIGKNCIIQPGVTIGADGFAFERHNSSLELESFPHMGGVIIRDNVEIFSNCSIARGSLSDTVIGKGTKLDALVHVAHNVIIGENCELTAGTIIGGSTIIGNSCWTGLNSTLKHKIKIGNKVIIGCGASVIHNVPDEDIVAGVPAKSIKHKVTTNQLFLMAGQQKNNNRKKILKGIPPSILGFVMLSFPLLTNVLDSCLN